MCSILLSVRVDWLNAQTNDCQIQENHCDPDKVSLIPPLSLATVSVGLLNWNFLLVLDEILGPFNSAKVFSVLSPSCCSSEVISFVGSDEALQSNEIFVQPAL